MTSESHFLTSSHQEGNTSTQQGPYACKLVVQFNCRFALVLCDHIHNQLSLLLSKRIHAERDCARHIVHLSVAESKIDTK